MNFFEICKLGIWFISFKKGKSGKRRKKDYKRREGMDVFVVVFVILIFGVGLKYFVEWMKVWKINNDNGKIFYIKKGNKFWEWK